VIQGSELRGRMASRPCLLTEIRAALVSPAARWNAALGVIAPFLLLATATFVAASASPAGPPREAVDMTLGSAVLPIAVATELGVSGAQTERTPFYRGLFLDFCPVGCTRGHWRKG
jgi:hypothetical protein